ncbi:MAG: hypothetical protein A3B76_03235 [Candidatus Andersenbacteria bacterium RIFCSPHIGHO2_02_FULL_46_16]|nr:MAG: hypothetical protein A3B76_03235 [Candidatus Andersenbacteria bacterium RIFCSPHIGHO2_02_FULL_46_16]
MARQRSEFLGSLGKLFEIFKKVVHGIIELGGDDDNIDRIGTDDQLAKDIAAVICGQAEVVYTKDRKTATIIVDDPALATALKSLENDMPDAVLINVNYVEHAKQQRTQRRGLDIALDRYGDTESPMILVSFEAQEQLQEDERFQQLIAKPNVAFLRLPASLDDYRDLYAQLI